jgi:transcriptional regulator with XRE-family HTH domain
MEELTTSDAVRKVSLNLTYYAIAKELGVRPIMVTKYRTGESRMGLTTAAKFEQIFGIKITDARRPGRARNENN